MNFYETQKFIDTLKEVCKNLNLKDISLPEDLTKRIGNTGWSIALEMASSGYMFPIYHPIIYERDEDDGWCIAHFMAYRGYNFPEDHPIIYEKDNRGNTVAHVMVLKGYQFSEYHPVLNEKNNNGKSVLDIMLSTLD